MGDEGDTGGDEGGAYVEGVAIGGAEGYDGIAGGL